MMSNSEARKRLVEACQWRSHSRPEGYEPCECEARLAQVITHSRTSTGGAGPDYCLECSDALSEWVPWTKCAARRIEDDQMPSVADGLAVAEGLLRRVVDYWDGRPLTHHGDHIYADLLDVLKAITPTDTGVQS